MCGKNKAGGFGGKLDGIALVALGGLVVIALALLVVDIVALVLELPMKFALFARGSTSAGRPIVASIGRPHWRRLSARLAACKGCRRKRSCDAAGGVDAGGVDATGGVDAAGAAQLAG